MLLQTCNKPGCPQKGTYGPPEGPLYCYYHDKMVKDLLQPLDSYSTPTEIDNLFRGRTRYDGRRLDAWTK